MSAPTQVLTSILGWLRAGYPQGIPREDYLPLLEVLHRRLTDTEVLMIVDQLSEASNGRAIERAQVEAAISRLALETPAAADVSRVASHLAAGGWPLAGFRD